MFRAFLADEVRDLHQHATIVDLHAHPILKAILFRRNLTRGFITPDFLIGELNPLSVQTSFPNLLAGEVDVLFSTAYPLEKRLFEDIRLFNLIPLKWLPKLPLTLIRQVWSQIVIPPYFTVTNTMLDYMEEQVRKYNDGQRGQPGYRPAGIAHSVSELNAALASPDKPITIIHSLEGGHCLEGEVGLRLNNRAWSDLTGSEQAAVRTEVLANLDAVFNRGVAYLVLAHFYPNKLIMPVFPYPEHLALSLIPRRKLDDFWRDVTLSEGLTELGREVVQRMIALGMLIDVSHATPKARKEIYTLAEGSPRPAVIATHVGAYELNPTPYNLQDWEIKWIADHGGVVGVIFMPYWLMPSETKFGLNFISRTIEYVFNVGGEAAVGIGTDFDGADPPDDLVDESKLSYLTERLFSEYTEAGGRRYTSAQIEAILGGNALRVVRAGWGRV